MSDLGSLWVQHTLSAQKEGEKELGTAAREQWVGSFVPGKEGQ